MDFKAAIFDLDGTLLDSTGLWNKISIDFIEKRGFTASQDYVDEMRNRSFIEAAKYTRKMFRLSESIDAIIDEWHDMALYEYSNNVGLLPYAFGYLAQLKEMKIKLAVATGLPELLYKPCLERNQIIGMFDALCSTEQVERGKESSDVYLFAANELGVHPCDCIVFEDILPAIKSAKQAGMKVYGISDKYSGRNLAEIQKIADGYLYDYSNPPYPGKER